MSDELVGKYFHVFDDKDRVLCQGIVEVKIDPGIYLVSYGDDAAYSMQLARVDDMLTWQFYETREAMEAWHQAHPEISPTRSGAR